MAGSDEDDTTQTAEQYQIAVFFKFLVRQRTSVRSSPVSKLPAFSRLLFGLSLFPNTFLEQS